MALSRLNLPAYYGGFKKRYLYETFKCNSMCVYSTVHVYEKDLTRCKIGITKTVSRIVLLFRRRVHNPDWNYNECQI